MEYAFGCIFFLQILEYFSSTPISYPPPPPTHPGGGGRGVRDRYVFGCDLFYYYLSELGGDPNLAEIKFGGGGVGG